MKPEQQKNLLYILVPSAILVILWIIFSVYNKSVKSTISSTQTQAIESISPSFPTEVLSDLKKRQSIEPLFAIDSIPSTESSESGTLNPSPTPTPSTTEQAPIATNSGEER